MQEQEDEKSHSHLRCGSIPTRTNNTEKAMTAMEISYLPRRLMLQ